MNDPLNSAIEDLEAAAAELAGPFEDKQTRWAAEVALRHIKQAQDRIAPHARKAMQQARHEVVGEPHTCWSRMNQPGPWQHAANLDHWHKVGPDRVCSFCGSMHPEDFERACERALVDGKVRIDPSTKGYKIYIYRPEIHNAGEGAIKFYRWHGYTDPADVERLQAKYAQAVEASLNRLRWSAALPEEGQA